MLAAAFFNDPLTLFAIGMVLMILFFWYFATELERRKRNVGTVLVLGVAALCFLAVYPPKERLKSSIDIAGGSSFSLRVQPRIAEDGTKEDPTTAQIDQAMKVVEQRLNGLGNAEPLISRQGKDGILIQMPGIDPEDSKRIRAILEKVAHLEFRQVHINNATLSLSKEFVPGYKLFPMDNKNKDSKESALPILLSRRVALGGSDISSASPSQQGIGIVDIVLNSDGENKMIALTEHMTPGQDRIAVVLDGVVISAPVVQSVPLGKQFQVSGLDKPGEALSLANSLMNPLENPLVVEEERTVSPLLGAAVVQQGVWAGLLGLGLTFIFVLIYYRTAGLVALVGLILNSLMLFGVMAMFGFPFSLPGIAGIVLTIGVAVDANVLINERLREELAAGKTVKAAVNAAYEKAFSAIFDSNITSLITAVILFWLASASVKGFAVTLTIGLLCSMFSAILATRVLFRWGIDLGFLKNLSFLNLIKSKNYDFLGKRVTSMTISLIMVAISLGAFAWKKERAFGIDFTGGTRVQFLLGDALIPTTEVEKLLNEGSTLHKAVFPQDETNPTSGKLLTIRCDTRDADAVEAKLRETYPALGEKITDAKGTHYKIDASREEVSGYLGGTFLTNSLLALGLGLLGILIYVTIRFEFSFAIGAFIALVHDCVIAAGFVVLFGRELSLIHVGAILTIAGYSINDTIIIFDRIRESFHERRGTLLEVMNEAINATLSRTILTSTATLVSVLSLAVLGGAALRDFSLVILIGIVVGTYSSIFVASPIVFWWSKGKHTKMRSDALDSNLAIEVNPSAQ
jgi:SecD/SecF fusion protein